MISTNFLTKSHVKLQYTYTFKTIDHNQHESYVTCDEEYLFHRLWLPTIALSFYYDLIS